MNANRENSKTAPGAAIWDLSGSYSFQGQQIRYGKMGEGEPGGCCGKCA